MHPHPIKLKREMPTQFRDRELVAFGCFVTIGRIAKKRFQDKIDLLHVALVEGEMHFDLLF